MVTQLRDADERLLVYFCLYPPQDVYHTCIAVHVLLGSSKRRKSRQKQALMAIEGGGTEDGRCGRSSPGLDSPMATAGDAALRELVRQLLREFLEYDDYLLADGNHTFEGWIESVRLNEDISLCNALRRWPVSNKLGLDFAAAFERLVIAWSGQSRVLRGDSHFVGNGSWLS